jgi:hypothetical protein
MDQVQESEVKGGYKMAKAIREELKKYPSTDTLKVIDTIGIPHPYCITPEHVVYASKHSGGMLTRDTICDAEKYGHASCDICKGQLSYEAHETALLIGVSAPGELKNVPGLQEYLLSIKEMAEADGYAGFAFKRVE